MAIKVREEHNLPEEKRDALAKARNIEWLMIVWQLTVIAAIYWVMGSSQAMKTAFVDDVLTLVPPIVFLIALKMRHRKPNESFPYGYSRAPILSFLAAAAATLVFGLYILTDSVMALISQTHPTLGHFNLFGWYVWIGWPMIVALAYSAIPSLVLGPIKIKLAKEVHEKTLYADADMNKADWMTSLAAILGILGIGMGMWWADAAAAIVISVDIIKDGASTLKGAMADLMDSRPTDVETGKPLELDERIVERIKRFPDVVDASVRLREAGNTITGEIFVELKQQHELARQLREMTKAADEIDWRIFNMTIIPVEDVKKN